MQGRSLFCRNEAERTRLIDMSLRLRGIERGFVACYLLFVAFGIPAYGWQPFLLLALGPVALMIVQSRVTRLSRPEYALFVAWLITQVPIVPAIALAHGPRVYMLALFINGVVLLCVVFPLRAAVIGTAFSAALMLIAAFAITPHAVIHTPPALIYPLVTLICSAIWSSATRDADIESRSTAVVDPLTRALNRNALEARVAELRHHARTAGTPVALLLGDLDHFKTINDEHGHATGDEVLREVAQRIRTCLRAFESLYRIGGEEFAVLLPDVDAAQALELAERLRAAVSREPAGGLPVTMSFGVSATGPDETFDYEHLFERADAALYEAKRGGRDQSRVASAAAPRDVALPRRRNDEPPQPRDNWRDRVVDDRAQTGNWLIQDSLQRAHMLAVLRRLDRVGHAGNLLIIGTLVSAGPFFGWWPLLPVVLGGIGFQMVESTLERFRRPEYALGLAWIAAAVVYALAFFLANKPPVVGLPFMLLMNVGFSAVFPARGVLIGGAVQGALLAAVAFGTGGDLVLADPILFVMPLALLGAVTLVGTVVGKSAVEHRGAAVVDPLTGLLNRMALDSRAAELSYQAAISREPLALILGDLDGFKGINDREGHATGDAVLQEVAARLRTHVRAFDSVYRLGGDEFVVLLPGVDWDGALELGERLREAVASRPVRDVPVTISLGVAADDQRSYAELFDAADQALYDAKRGGRDRVASSAAWPMSTR
jgi:two-component system, cell cycle response regulator